MGDTTTLATEKNGDEQKSVISPDEMRMLLMGYIPTVFPSGNWMAPVEAEEYINILLGTIPHKSLILVPNHLTKLIWDCPSQMDGEYTLHYLMDLGYGRADAILLQGGKWLVIHQNRLSKQFYCVLV